ncbi:MAG: hypothetical protein AAF990_13355, partial [Bacteroidota bacterium]
NVPKTANVQIYDLTSCVCVTQAGRSTGVVRMLKWMYKAPTYNLPKMLHYLGLYLGDVSKRHAYNQKRKGTIARLGQRKENYCYD